MATFPDAPASVNFFNANATEEAELNEPLDMQPPATQLHNAVDDIRRNRASETRWRSTGGIVPAGNKNHGRTQHKKSKMPNNSNLTRCSSSRRTKRAVSSVFTSRHFFVNYKDYDSQLEQLIDLLSDVQIAAASSPGLDLPPYVGLACLAFFIDGSWNRARVGKIFGDCDFWSRVDWLRKHNKATEQRHFLSIYLILGLPQAMKELETSKDAVYQERQSQRNYTLRDIIAISVLWYYVLLLLTKFFNGFHIVILI